MACRFVPVLDTAWSVSSLNPQFQITTCLVCQTLRRVSFRLADMEVSASSLSWFISRDSVALITRYNQRGKLVVNSQFCVFREQPSADHTLRALSINLHYPHSCLLFNIHHVSVTSSTRRYPETRGRPGRCAGCWCYPCRPSSPAQRQRSHQRSGRSASEPPGQPT